MQFMGKDNVPFHTIVFPAVLLGLKQQWTKMQGISVTEYLNYEGDKFAKSRGVGALLAHASGPALPRSYSPVIHRIPCTAATAVLPSIHA